MRHAVASLALALSFVLADAAPAAAQVLPPQHAARVFLPIAANRRPFGAYGERTVYGWRTTDSVIDVLRWDGLAFTVTTYRRDHWSHLETVLTDASGERVTVWQDVYAAPEIRDQATGRQFVFVENVGLSTQSAARQPFRRYADALVAECAVSRQCQPERIEWRGVTP